MAREPIPTWFFVVVIVRLGRRFLLIQEAKHEQRWYFPAGRIEPGETILEAARRETLEEAGIPIEAEGFLRIEHSVLPNGLARVRFLILAHPADDTPPKSQPDEESLRAMWVTRDALDQLSLRSSEVRQVIDYLSSGAPVYPLSLVVPEYSPYPGTPGTAPLESP